MIRNVRLGLLALFVAGLVLVSGEYAVRAADKEEVKKAMELVAELVKTDGKGADAAAKKTSIDAVMHLFKPGSKGGIGVGPKGDGIEIKIMNLAKKALPADQLKKEADDLITLAKQTRAIADLTEQYAPKTKVAGKDPKDWKKHNDEMKKFSGDFIEAVKGGKADDVKKLANSINSSCVNCHSIFRD